jgi:hypothetical protein
MSGKRGYRTNTAFGNTTTPRPTADAWCVYEFDGARNPVIVDSVGISKIERVNSPDCLGVHRVFFTNPQQFISGSYVVLVQSQSLTNNPNSLGLRILHGSTATIGATAPGASASFDIVGVAYSGRNAFIRPAVGADAASVSDSRIRTNFAVFCLRSDKDLYKPFVGQLFSTSNFGSSWSRALVAATNFTETAERFFHTGETVWSFLGTNTGNNYVAQGAGEVNTRYTFSVYAKAKVGLQLELLIGGGGNNFGYSFNLIADSFSSVGTVPSGGTLSGYIESLADGWKRCVISASTPNAPTPLIKNSTNNTEILVTSPQLELGSVATKYVKRVGAFTEFGDQNQLITLQPGVRGLGQDSRQNLFAYSEDFSNAFWTKNVLGVCGGFTAPDGSTTAYKLWEFGGQTTYKNIQTGVAGSTVDTGPLVFSFHAKAAERKYVSIQDAGYGQYSKLVVDLETGKVTENSLGLGVHTIPLADGWWRVVVPVYTTDDRIVFGQNRRVGMSPNIGPTTDTIYGPGYVGVSYDAGNGYGIYIWGAQIERGTVYGDYVKTSGSVFGNGTIAPRGATHSRVTGLTYESSSTKLANSREATAWGTIVVPALKSNAFSTTKPPVYLENHYGVSGVECKDVTGWVYDVKFTTPMDLTDYCVITSTEQEPLAETEAITSGSLGAIPTSEEFSYTVVQRADPAEVAARNRRDSFRLRTFRQTSRGIGSVVMATDTNTNTVAAGNASYKLLYTYTHSGATRDLVFRWESMIDSGNTSYNIKVKRNRGGTITNQEMAGLPSPQEASFFYYYHYDTGFAQTRTPHEFRKMKTFIRDAAPGDVYTIEAAPTDANGTLITANTGINFKIKNVAVNEVDTGFLSTYNHCHAGREQRINFMVFGGRMRYGTQ